MLDKTKVETVVVSAPNYHEAEIEIVGTAPYVMNKFSGENRRKMMEKQEAGHRAKKGEKRAPKNFDAVYKGAMHVSTEGWFGIPSSALRQAMIGACRDVGFHMTRAKQALFVLQDGIDADDGTPLVKLTGKPTRRDIAVRLANGSTDIIARPFFDKWSAKVRIEWDADQFSGSDVTNLLSRAGKSVGIGAGRPASKSSAGCGWGTFKIK